MQVHLHTGQVNNMADIKQLQKLLQFNLNQQPEQFNMTTPENLMLPIPEPTLSPKKVSAPASVPPKAEVPKITEMNPTVKEYIKSKYGLLDPES